MSEVFPLSQAWTLLKDYSLLNHLSDEYYDALSERMLSAIERREPLTHVNPRPTEHYEKSKRKRYHEGQKLPRQFQGRAFKNFTVEDIMNFMAEDLAHQHPELLEVMRQKKPASDDREPDREPSMVFDALRTDNPKMEGRRGHHHIVSPHFHLDESGKLQLNTVGHGKMQDKTRQTIQVVPSTSPVVGDVHDNSAIDEALPNRFDFMERRVPEGMQAEQAPEVEEADPFGHLPPAFREMARQQAEANKQASEPMDLAWRMLKVNA